MSKKARFRTRLNSQHVEGLETLPQSARQHFYQIVWLHWEKLTGKLSLLVISEILGLPINTLSANGNYSLHNKENLL